MFTYLSLKTQNHIFFTIQHTQSRFENTNSIHAFVGDNDPGIQLPLYSFGKNNVLILANQNSAGNRNSRVLRQDLPG